jgi:hypothetical protein
VADDAARKAHQIVGRKLSCDLTHALKTSISLISATYIEKDGLAAISASALFGNENTQCGYVDRFDHMQIESSGQRAFSIVLLAIAG